MNVLPPNHHIVLHQSSRDSSGAAARCHFPAVTKRRCLSPMFSSSPSSQDLTISNEENDSETDRRDYEADTFRTHNAKSAAVLRELPSLNEEGPQPPSPENQGYQLPFLKEDKEKLLELSLLSRRPPLYPGSILLNRTPQIVQSVFEKRESSSDGDDGAVDDEMLMKALKIRRKVTVEVFKQAMHKGKFGITYSENIVSKLPEFLDFVMIKAATMKKLPEFSCSSYNDRAKIFIDESGVIPLIRWLKHNSLSYPQIGKLICASKGNLDLIRSFAEWLKSIHVHGRFIGVALTRAGEHVFERNLDELDEMVQYLESNGVRSDWMGYVISRCPEILCFSMEEVKFRVEFYLNMGMSANDFGTMLFDCPKVLGYLSIEEMNKKVSYLKEFGLNNEDMGRLLAFKPQLMACSIEERWMPLVKYFYYLGISKDGMRRILTVKPIIFCIDLESTIVPKVQFLRDIGVEDDAIGSVLTRYPSLFTHSLYKKIRPVVIFLLTRAGVTQRDIGKVIALGPELLGCNIANKLDQNVKYFLSLGIALPVLGKMVADFPMLLRYNVDVLRPKYQYLRRMMVRPLQDVVEFPRFFSYSLEERIIPRHKITVENRINFKLRYMLGIPDEEFQVRVQEAVERRERFESGFTYQNASQVTHGKKPSSPK